MRLKAFVFSIIALLVVVGATGAVLYATGALGPKVRTDVDLGEKRQDHTPKYRYVAELCERLDVSKYELVAPLKKSLQVNMNQEPGSDSGGYVQCTAEFDVDATASVTTLLISSTVFKTESEADQNFEAGPKMYDTFKWEDLPGPWQRGSIGYGNSRATGITEIQVATKDGKHYTDVVVTIPGHVDRESELAAAAYASALQVLELAREKPDKK